jgi:predicted flap endonuclease-1-like 5' DNA nuclease
MAYLLSKYTFIYLLAVALGFVFGYWWARRRFVDVTESYTRMSNMDLASVNQRLDALNASISNLRGVELTPPQSESHTAEPPAKAPPMPPADADTRPSSASGGPVLLDAASHGEPDDLKKISGVGPKLEGLLHQNGVYYFWQIAEWSARDIEIVDTKLAAFKGRIARDNWVSQAKTLAKAPGSAARP